jgi:hypothetical protein
LKRLVAICVLFMASFACAAVERAGLTGGDVVLEVGARACSKIIGQKRSNLIRLQRETATRVKKVVQREDSEGVCVRPYPIQKKQ